MMLHLHTVGRLAAPLLFVGALAAPALAQGTGSSDAAPATEPASAAPDAAPTEGAKPAETPKKDVPPGKRVLVLPYQGIFRSVPQKKLDDATELLVKEMTAQEGLAIVRGAVADGGGSGPSLDAAKAAEAEADAAEAAREIGKAIAARERALAEYEKNAGALSSIGPYFEAQHRLARTYALAGRDEDAKRVLETTARMSPGFELPRDAYSRLHAAWFVAAAERAVAERRGKILVKSSLPGARIEIDGRAADVAPVLLEKVVPGKHLIVARLDGVTPFATTIEAEAGKDLTLMARFGNTLGGDAVGDVTDALAQNELSKGAVSSASKAGQQAGAAWVVFGAMAKDDDKFRVHTYVVEAKSGRLAALDVLNFDLELLTAESDILALVKNAARIIEAFPSGETAVAVIEKRIRRQDLTNRFNASPELAVIEEDTGKDDKKAGRRPVFRPLKGGSITIKDEVDD